MIVHSQLCSADKWRPLPILGATIETRIPPTEKSLEDSFQKGFFGREDH